MACADNKNFLEELQHPLLKAADQPPARLREMRRAHGYRADIDGLRGLAVLFVIAFHYWGGLLPGGFIGVDIFFVISGYLISSIIFHDVISNDFSIRRFYQRRVKRILPSLIVVMSGTLFLGWLLLWASEYRNLGKHVFGGATFISNILLWRETGYFANEAEYKPLIHLWSLGVEEQFYIAFPICVWLIVRFKPKYTTLFLGAAFAISFGLCAFGTKTHANATFYLPITRLWELLVGCILAAFREEYSGLNCGYFARTKLDQSVSVFKDIASLIGAVMIALAAFLISGKQSFPGGWALIPTIGAMIVIFAGERSLFSRWVLSNKVLVGIGLISYPLYLWHWPLLVFLRLLSNGAVSRLALGGCMALAFLLALVTYFCIERPIRSGTMFRVRTTLCLSSSAAALLVVGLLVQTQLLPSRLASRAIGKDVDEAFNDWDYPFKDNLMRMHGFTKDAEMGLGKAHSAVVLIGDSHMQQYWPRIKLALRSLQEESRPVILITAGGTPTLPNVNRLKAGYACDKWFDFAMQEALRTNVGTVVFTCYWESYFKGNFPSVGIPSIYLATDPEKTPLRLQSSGADQVFRSFGGAVRSLVEMGKSVYVVLSSPSCADWSPARVSRIGSELSPTNRLGVLRKEYEAFVLPVEERIVSVVLANGGKVVNPRDALEEDGFFYGRSMEGRFRYKDNSHMRPFFVKEKAGFIDALVGIH